MQLVGYCSHLFLQSVKLGILVSTAFAKQLAIVASESLARLRMLRCDRMLVSAAVVL
jgi:hypothetical protein